MDSELEQLQSLGFFGTIKESFKILFPWKKIFTYITLTLILPLSILYLVQIEISDLISSKVSNTPSNSNTDITKQRPRSLIWLTLFKSVGFFFYLTFYLLSTAAIVYTVACIYTAKQTTYKKVISVVPIVWKKRLLRTYRCSVPIILIYNVVAIGILFFWLLFILNTGVGILVGVWILTLYVVGILYISVIWQLACVVSVLEDKYGLKAMIKSRELIKGKEGVGVGTIILFGLFFGGIYILFEKFVVVKWSPPISILVTIGCVVLLVPVTLLFHVVQTIIYFVCKSYHSENIDKSSLSDHLEEYLVDYVKLNKSKDVQLEQQSDSGV